MRSIVPILVMVSLCTACAKGHGSRGVYIDFIRPDQHPPNVGPGAAADSLWGPIEESERGDGIADSHRANLEALVQRFAPTLVLPKADHVKVDGRRYQLVPTDASLVADTLWVDRIRAAPYALHDSLEIPLYSLDPDSLVALTDKLLRYETGSTFLEAWYFDWIGDRASEWWKEYGRLRSGPDSARWARPTVYAHPFVHSDGRVVIQYWFFYPFNDHIGNHEGDWEHINVVPTPDRKGIAEVHYYFHVRSVRLPEGKYEPEVVDGTHPVVYAGGRLYNVLDFPIRWFTGEHNEGAHGTYPYPGEWEGAGGMGAPESVHKADRDSVRVVPYQRFKVVLMPEPSRIDYRRKPAVLKQWMWLLIPVRWGFPSVTSVGSEMGSVDVGNRAPFGPAYNPAWNRTAPGLHYPGYHPKKIGFLRSLIEDLLQPWYYLYIFRTPRYADDPRGGDREILERMGLLPRGGSHEAGIGATIVGVNSGWPVGSFSETYEPGTGVSLWRNFGVKLRFLGYVEAVTGYQRFTRDRGPDESLPGGSLIVYPIIVGGVVRAPNGWLYRPYASIGGGLYRWNKTVLRDDGSQFKFVGWNLGWMPAVGIEYYLRPRVALDIGLRYHHTGIPAGVSDVGGGNLRFFTLWIGHFVRF